jgi:mono/diheme cytochrome c family protein
LQRRGGQRRKRPLIATELPMTARALVLVASLLVSTGVQAQQIGEPGQGHALAKQICAQCHAVEAGPAVSPNAAAPRFEDIADTPGMTETALSAALRTSHRTMPNVMPDSAQLNNIIAYILSLKHADR